MQMGSIGVPRISKQAKRLTAPDPITDLHADALGLKMGVKGVAAVAKIERNVVTAAGFGVHIRGWFREGYIVAYAIVSSPDSSVRDGHHLRAVAVEARILQPVAAQGHSVRAELYEVVGK